MLPGKTAAQQVLNGVVKDRESKETLIGASVVIRGTTEGAVTDLYGRFRLETMRPFPVTIEVSFIGYETLVRAVSSAEKLTIMLRTSSVMLSNVEITGSRISEKQKQNPLTVETMDIIAVRETPAANFYEGLGHLKGVDVTAASLGFKVINTRGFNSTSPVRSLQLIDGVDNQSPGLNFALGNFLGVSELDLQKVELVVGASTAFYGPNAFNGVIDMTTRSPFIKPGLEVSYKVGERNLSEFSFRWADYTSNKQGEKKFGYKINWYTMSARDWNADNLSPTPQSRNDELNLGGYDAVNRYGDEYSSLGDYSFTGSAKTAPGLGTYYRRGYAEKDLVDYDTENMKLGASLHFLLDKDLELIAASNFGSGTTVYQGDNRYSLKDVLFFQNRLELRKPGKYFIRAYATNEHSGKSYDAFSTALLLQQNSKGDIRWYQDYSNKWVSEYANILSGLPGFPQPPVYNPNDTVGYGAAYTAYLNAINPFLENNFYDTLIYYHQLAQAFANGPGQPGFGGKDFIEPGTVAFDTAFARITSTLTTEGGSLFYDRSALYHLQGEYRYNMRRFDIVTGGNYRLYRPRSRGTIFADTAYVKYETDPVTGDTISASEDFRSITNREYGVYAGLERKLANEKLKLSATLRVDKNENFDYLFSPAASAVYLFNDDNLVRLSYSSAIRNPTLADQYLYFFVGRALLIGNINGFDSLVTIPSLFDALAFQNPDTLDYFNVDPIRPEKVQTIEGGFRMTLKNRLYADFNAYYSRYRDFIGYKVGADVRILNLTSSVAVNQVYRVAANSLDRVDAYGASGAITYFPGKYVAMTGNYSFNRLDRRGSTDPLIPAYNTPAHKFNLGMSLRDWKKWGMSFNYKWVEGFRFEGSPQFTGDIATYDMVDVQVNRKIPAIHTTFKVGANNILDNRHYEVFGGPQVGRLVYFSVLVEIQGK